MVAESWLSIATFVICEGGGMLELDIIGRGMQEPSTSIKKKLIETSTSSI